ncbi:MAG TPA: glycosyltransferase [Miltoncostaeaceae bacterium]|nr:glycosyltransferase [Miltoncostaeaceae bacterium]
MSGPGPLRVLCLSNMWPGPRDPDYGAFVADMCGALRARGLSVETAAIDHRASGPLRTPAKYAQLARGAMGAARRADVIYAHFLFPTGALAAQAARAASIPFVVTAHGQDVRNLERWSARRGTAAALRRAGAVIAVSEYLADELRASGIALPPLHVVNMGVDLDRFAPGDRGAARARLGLPAEGPLVVAVGGLTERKNPLTLLQAFARLRERRPDARLALVGDGPLRGAVHAGARRPEVAGAVVLPDAVPHDAVRDWIAACDVLALVSRVEPLGIAALEALAGGRPVVATRVGGAREVVPDPAAGRVVDPLDPGAVAGALLAVLDDPPSPDACRRAAEPHSLERQSERVATILRETAAAQPS